MLIAQEKITVKEFLKMDFADPVAYYELINGEIVRKSSPSTRHQDIVLEFAFLLKSHIKKTKNGRVFVAPLDVFLNEENAIQPDVFFISNENSHIIDEKDGILGVPDLVVEVISPTSIRRDRFDKKKVYGAVGVKEYWLIDPNNESIEVYENREKVLELIDLAAEEGKVSSKLLDDFAVEMKDLF